MASVGIVPCQCSQTTWPMLADYVANVSTLHGQCWPATLAHVG